MNWIMPYRWVKVFCLGWLLALIACSSVSAEVLPLPPKPDRLVTDLAKVLSTEQQDKLERRLLAYEDTTSTQFAIVIEPTAGDETPFDRSFRMADSWGIGRKGKDNGLLIYVAVNDRKIFIQVGYGLEPVITDGITRLIIERTVKPNFREGRYYEGLDECITMLAKAAGGEFEGTGKRSPEGLPFWVLVSVILLVFIVIGLIGRFAKKGYGTYGRGGYMGGFGPMGGGTWGKGGMGGGGFGGGFGGFGGGGFGGGGAGGSW